MATHRDFQEYVFLYLELEERYKTMREQRVSGGHEYFEMRFLEIESNAWIPRFIHDMKDRLFFNFSDQLLEHSLDELCNMERELNTL